MSEILSPLETSTEILQRTQHCTMFKSPQLQIMAVHAMAMIEREKKVNKMMSRVALILQGDDPLYPELGYGMGEGCSTARMGMFFFSSRRRHTRLTCDWSSDVCSSD